MNLTIHNSIILCIHISLCHLFCNLKGLLRNQKLKALTNNIFFYRFHSPTPPPLYKGGMRFFKNGHNGGGGGDGKFLLEMGDGGKGGMGGRACNGGM